MRTLMEEIAFHREIDESSPTETYPKLGIKEALMGQTPFCPRFQSLRQLTGNREAEDLCYAKCSEYLLVALDYTSISEAYHPGLPDKFYKFWKNNYAIHTLSHIFVFFNMLSEGKWPLFRKAGLNDICAAYDSFADKVNEVRHEIEPTQESLLSDVWYGLPVEKIALLPEYARPLALERLEARKLLNPGEPVDAMKLVSGLADKLSVNTDR